jgi:predicted amidohydrolase
MKQVKVALIQFGMIPARAKDETLEHAKALLGRASQEEVQIACFPERWNYKQGKIEDNLEAYKGPTMNFLQKSSEEFGIYIIAGGIWVYNEDKTENHISSGVFNSKGELLGVQRKIHLYLSEKNAFVPGKELIIFNTEFGKIGVAICFDMTFPEVGRFYSLNDVDLIFSPVLIREEGIENWHIYLKARALENRTPVCAVNCIGRWGDQHYAGQSMMIDFKKGYETPSKLQIRTASADKEQVLIDDLDLNTAQKLRKKRLTERLAIDDIILGKKG